MVTIIPGFSEINDRLYRQTYEVPVMILAMNASTWNWVSRNFGMKGMSPAIMYWIQHIANDTQMNTAFVLKLKLLRGMSEGQNINNSG